MDEKGTQNNGPESPHYQDPLRKLGFGVFGDSDLELKAESSYPPVAELYQGFYADIEVDPKGGRGYLIGAEAIIGSSIASRADRSDGQNRRLLQDREGKAIGYIKGEDAIRLNDLEARGFKICCYLALVTYTVADRSFGAQVAWMAFYPGAGSEYLATFTEFTKNIADRISHGTRPRLRLQQNQIGKVLESGGSWFFTNDEAAPSLPKGTQSYKRKKSLTDNLVAVALVHRPGCTVAASVFWIALIALIVWLIIMWVHR